MGEENKVALLLTVLYEVVLFAFTFGKKVLQKVWEELGKDRRSAFNRLRA